jgi:hypothetical protein
MTDFYAIVRKSADFSSLTGEPVAVSKSPTSYRHDVLYAMKLASAEAARLNAEDPSHNYFIDTSALSLCDDAAAVLAARKL